MGAIIAAPAIVRAASLMPVRGIVMDVPKLVTIPESITQGWMMVEDHYQSLPNGFSITRIIRDSGGRVIEARQCLT